MDWLQFTAAIVGHLVWPVVILIVLFVLRKHLGSLADRLIELSLPGTTFKFEKLLEKGAEIIEHVPLPALPVPTEPELPLEQRAVVNSPMKSREEIAKNYMRRRRKRRAFLNRSSLGKVISGLEEVDNLLFEIGDSIGIDAAEASSVMYALVARKQIPKTIGKLYDTLRDARNVIAHSPTLPNELEASEYLRQASFLKTFLQSFRVALDPKTDKSND